MSDQSASANASVMLTAPAYNKLGYAFVGWSTQENGFGTTYQANETITAPSTQGTTGLQLYAKWLPSAGEMQNWSGCSTLGEHQTVALTDSRDGKTYAVRKLKDGNCWMVNDLSLELANFSGTNNLTSDNTDLSISRTDLVDLGNGKKAWDPGKSTYDKYNATNGTLKSELAAANLTNDFTGLSELLLGQAQPAQFQSAEQTGYIWGSMYEEDGTEVELSETECVTTYQNWTAINKCIRVTGADLAIPRSYIANSKEKTYYNWYAATAESMISETDAVSDAPDSICPAGWQLPIGIATSAGQNIDKTFNKLILNSTDGYGLTDGIQETDEVVRSLRNAPLSMVATGYYRAGSGAIVRDRYSSGYWTSAPISNGKARNFYATIKRNTEEQTLLSVGMSDYKTGGNAVRCIKR